MLLFWEYFWVYYGLYFSGLKITIKVVSIFNQLFLQNI